MPSGTTPTVARSGYWSSTPASVSSRAMPSFTPGQTTTCPCTSMPPSSSTLNQRRLVAPLGLRNMWARNSGSVLWIETNRGPRRSVRIRSASSSVNLVNVVKFPYRKESR